jgi:hypothetical protein
MALQRSTVSLILRVALLHLAVTQKMRRAGWSDLEKTTWSDALHLVSFLRKLASRGIGNAQLMIEMFDQMISLGRDLEVGDVKECECRLAAVPQTFNPL